MVVATNFLVAPYRRITFDSFIAVYGFITHDMAIATYLLVTPYIRIAFNSFAAIYC